MNILLHMCAQSHQCNGIKATNTFSKKVTGWGTDHTWSEKIHRQGDLLVCCKLYMTAQKTKESHC